jgi:hypothetical protein
MRIRARNVRIIALASLAALALCLSLSTSTVPRAEAATITLQQFGSNVNSPVGIVHAGDGSDRLFIVDQAGRIRVMTSAGVLLPTPFLDITALMPNPRGFEEGLLGLAFHPDYENNGFFYVYYNDTGSNIDITRTRVRRRASTRSGRLGYATRGGSRSTASPATCSLVTSDRV